MTTPVPNPPRDPGPNLNKEPLRTGNPPDMHVGREDIAFGPPDWVVDRMSAGVLMLIIMAVLAAIGIAMTWGLPDLTFW